MASRVTWLVYGLLAAVLTCAAGAAQAYPYNRYSLGVEGFRDRYLEPGSVKVDEHSTYGSITGSFMHNVPDGIYTWMAGIEARASYGKDDYKSPSGVINGIPQYEFETRVIAGVRLPFMPGAAVVPYTGIGARYFLDNNKGNVTNLGYWGYDRRITQYYVPIGVAMPMASGGWTFTPKIEADPMFLGRVNSRLRNGGTGLDNITNTQKNGFGIRGEFMIGQSWGAGGWEFGPFIRYWNIKDSKPVTDQTNPAYVDYEPKNTRLQTGAALKVDF